MKTPKSKTISFRVPLDAADVLIERCERTKQSVGEYARAIVLDTLYERDKAVLTEALSNVNDSIADLQESIDGQSIALRRIAFALLTSDSKLEKEEALAVMAQIFKSHP